MRAKHVLTTIILALFFSSCSQKGEGDLNKKIEDLELKVEVLTKQLEDQKLKTRISFMTISSNLISNTPFEDFVFASDEFWENPVDVGLLECSRDCKNAAKTRREVCEKMPNGPDKIKCFEESALIAHNCQAACQERFPPLEE